MLVVETIGRIRREHLGKGKSIKEIARDLKISRNRPPSRCAPASATPGSIWTTPVTLLIGTASSADR